MIRDVEAAVHSISVDKHTYEQGIAHAITNIYINASNADPERIVASSDRVLSGTVVERIAKTRQERRERFEAMLQEKYDGISSSMNKSYDSSLKCRRCNSVDVTWDQKQTRGADEAMTVFCVCTDCGNCWKIT